MFTDFIKKSITAKFMIYIIGLVVFLLVFSSFTQITISSSNLEKTLKENSVAFTKLSKEDLIRKYVSGGEEGRIALRNTAKNLLSLNSALETVEIYNLTNRKVLYSFNQKKQKGNFGGDKTLSEIPGANEEIIARVIKLEDSKYIQIISSYDNNIEGDHYAVRYLFSLEDINSRVGKLKFIMFGITALSVLLGAIAAIILAKYITDPINELSKKSETASRGAVDTKINIKREDEIGGLANSVKRLLSTIRILQKRDVPASEREEE